MDESEEIVQKAPLRVVHPAPDHRDDYRTCHGGEVVRGTEEGLREPSKGLDQAREDEADEDVRRHREDGIEERVLQRRLEDAALCRECVHVVMEPDPRGVAAQAEVLERDYKRVS